MIGRVKHSKASSNDWFRIFPNARFGELFTEAHHQPTGNRRVDLRDHRQPHPHLIAASPGFTTTERMPTNAFRAKDLSFYVKQSELE